MAEIRNAFILNKSLANNRRAMKKIMPWRSKQLANPKAFLYLNFTLAKGSKMNQ
jgi:hypothetical protein